MTWQLALGTLILVNTASIVLTKVAADKLPSQKSVGIFYQYLFCAIAAICLALFSAKAELNATIAVIAGVGLINAFGNYFQWQASALSLSKTALFFPLMEVVTIVLALMFLGEIILWSPQLIVGAGLCFLAMWLFRIPKKTDNGAEKETLSAKWLFFALLMILIFGVAGFLLKVFAFTIPRETFLMAWYGGAFIGAWPILALEKQDPRRVTTGTILIVLPVAIAILGALFFLYYTYQLGGPVSLILPIRGFGITLIPVLIGWWLFHERQRLSFREWTGFATGAVGAILVLLK